MEKCGDICLIDRLRIFYAFAILFCSLTRQIILHRHHLPPTGHIQYYMSMYFSSSVLISESVFTSASEISASFQLSLIHFYQTLLLDSCIYWKISMNSFPVIVSRWIKNSAASSRMSIFSRMYVTALA